MGLCARWFHVVVLPNRPLALYIPEWDGISAAVVRVALQASPQLAQFFPFGGIFAAGRPDVCKGAIGSASNTVVYLGGMGGRFLQHNVEIREDGHEKNNEGRTNPSVGNPAQPRSLMMHSLN